MQSGRKFSSDDRGIQLGGNRGSSGASPKAAVRNVDADRRRTTTVVKAGEGSKAKVASVVNLPFQSKAARKPPAPNAPVPKPKGRAGPPVSENRVSYSIQKLLSVYENSEDKMRPRPPDDGKATPYGRHGGSATATLRKNAAPDGPGSRKNSPVNVQSKRTGPVQGEKTESPRGRTRKASESVATRKPAPKKRTTPEEAKTKVEESEATEEVEGFVPEKRDELVPILVPERSQQTPANILGSFITSYLDEGAEGGGGTGNRLDFLLTKYDDSMAHVFPVCSKRGMDDIPSTEASEGASAVNSDLIIMLRRRNSEPNSHRNCLLRYGLGEESAPFAVGSGVWGLGCDYYFWEHRNRPFWQVSLFRANRSLSVLASREHSGMLTPPGCDLNGKFSDRSLLPASEAPSTLKWLPDVSYCSSPQGVAQTLTFVTLMQRGRTPSYRDEDATANPIPETPPSETASKLPEATMAEEKDAPSEYVKTEKITRSVTVELRPSAWHKHTLLTVASAVVLVTGVFIFAYFLGKPHSIFSLAPPVPELVREF